MGHVHSVLIFLKKDANYFIITWSRNFHIEWKQRILGREEKGHIGDMQWDPETSSPLNQIGLWVL
jgi:hypothetical protein